MSRGGTQLLTVVLLAAALVLLAAAAPALAVERFASATGGIAGDCTNTAGNPPCSFDRAVEDVPVAGDVITVLPDGTYSETSQVTVGVDIEIRGAPGQPRPLIGLSSATGLSLADTGSELRDVTIFHTGVGGTGLIASDGALVERVYVASTAAFNACSVRGTTTIRDSVCLNTATIASQHGLTASSPTAPGSSVINARNVTAIATGPTSNGIRVVALGAGQNVGFDARNTIAQGTGDDVLATASAGGGTANGVLGNSNYDDATEIDSGGSASVTQEGNPANQVAPPIFANAAAGDFHQAPGSPTIDAGLGSATLLGSLDLDGDPRVVGAAIDIGAYEFVPPAAGGEADTRAPFTLISKQPKKKTRKRKATFTFGSDEPGSTFECSLDDGPFEPCASPLKYRRLEGGKHVFAVRGIDPAGNVGEAAQAKWKVRPRHR